jgi:hypothetical protein
VWVQRLEATAVILLVDLAASEALNPLALAGMGLDEPLA